MQQALAAFRDTPLADVPAALEADASFHRWMFAATGNQLLVAMSALIKVGMHERDRRLRSYDEVPDPVLNARRSTPSGPATQTKPNGPCTT